MHQSLAGLPPRVVVDTNVLLNASFISDGSARYAITQLGDLGFSSVIDGAVEEEAVAILRKLRIKLALPFDPVGGLQSFIRHAKILVLPRAALHVVPGVNRADRHVYSAAKHYGAWILTGDVELAAQSFSGGIPARLPWDVLMETATREKKDPPLHYVLRFIGISAERGFIFGRVIPGNWAGMKSVGRFTVCEVENVARLLYDSDAGQWVFAVAGKQVAKANCPLEKDEHWTVCGSYVVSSGKGNATLRAFSTNGKTIHTSIAFGDASFHNRPGRASFGHSVIEADHWNGWIRKIVVAPKSMTKNAWRALRHLPESAPDPTSGNVLEAALRKVTLINGIATVPSEQALREAWI